MIERSRYLCALRDSIADQSKLRAREGIASYEEGPDGVTVTTDKGNRIQGSLLIGADGVHSSIRSMLYPKIDTTKRASHSAPAWDPRRKGRSANTRPWLQSSRRHSAY